MDAILDGGQENDHAVVEDREGKGFDVVTDRVVVHLEAVHSNPGLDIAWVGNKVAEEAGTGVAMEHVAGIVDTVGKVAGVEVQVILLQGSR